VRRQGFKRRCFGSLASTAPVQTATAATAAAGRYTLFVAEMREAFMAGMPLHMLRIS
jgi:hypothetical protein